MSTDTVRNIIWDELEVGQTASLERVCADRDLFLFAHVSGNLNPKMLPGEEGEKAVAPSMWVASLISAVLGNHLPGPGTFYRAQSLRFLGRVAVGERLKVTVTCTEKLERPVALFKTTVALADGTIVCEGIGEVDVPTEVQHASVHALPGLILDEIDHFAPLIARAAQLPAIRVGIVCPDDANSLGGALLAHASGLIQPVLLGNRAKIEAAAVGINADISGFELVEIEGHRAAAARAVAMVHEGKLDALMKGNVHSDDLLGEVVKKDGGLRGDRRITHVFVMDVPTQPNLLFISDAAINITPDLTTKIDIVQNAIDVAIACGAENPRVGILSAVETVNPAIPSTIDAAVLSKMAERGQIKGGIVDGPLAMDNAIDMEAARTKGITSLVAGRAEVLIVPNMEAGNMLAKELTFLARAEAAGLVLGARVPVMLTSRADNDRARLASTAVALLYAHFKKTGTPFRGTGPSALAEATAQ